MISRNKKIQQIIYWLGALLLSSFLVACIFLRASFLAPLINQIRGHIVTPVGLEKIDTYFLSIKILLFLWGVVFLYVGRALKDPRFLEASIGKLKTWWRWIINLNTKKFLIIIFVVSFLLRIGLSLNFNEFNLSHDGAHYLSLAESLAHGNGFISHALWAVYLLPDSIPFPDLYRAPLWPYLLSFGGFITDNFFRFGLLINSFFGALVPVLLYLLTRSVTKSEQTARIAAIIIFLNSALINWSTTLLTELLYVVLVLLILIFLYKKQTIDNLFIGGVLWALAFLARREALVVLPGVIILILWTRNRKFKAVCWRFIFVLAVFLICIFPWLNRTYQLTGDVWYSDIKYHVVPVFGDDYVKDYIGSFRQLTPPESNVFAFAIRNPVAVFRHACQQCWDFIGDVPLKIFSSVFLPLLLLLGLWRGRRYRQFYPLYFFLCSSLIFYLGISYATRYIFVLVPVFAVFMAFFLENWSTQNFKFFKWDGRVFVLPLIIVLSGAFIFGIKSNIERNSFDQPKLVAFKKVAEKTKGGLAPDEAVMISNDQIYQYHYFSGQNCLQFPDANLTQLTDIIKKYKVRYMLIFADSPKSHWQNIEEMGEQVKRVYQGNLFKEQYYYLYEVD
ncbi:glycosyltransferase family 39 protein [Patescibacteria group bacterium]|nr:glycosyltransferase family 39 protein [Patescibacteria group bacterium]MBU4511771.1 glycosyltransferase family 39 protein [Patescibacteria group bacterium]